ncbi:MAG: hypothetical protein AB7O97_05735 [Planctomycetota bacterium]
MKALIAAVVALVLGMAAFVVIHERGKDRGAATRGADARVLTISTGEQVDVEAHVRPDGATLVEFTAEF